MLAVAAIRGQRSAASRATGPLMSAPFAPPLPPPPHADRARRGGDPRPAFGRLAGHGALDVRSLRLPFRGHDHARIVFELDHRALGPTEGAPLSHDDGPHELLPRLRSPLLHRHDEEVRDARARKPMLDPVVLRDL